MPPEQAQQQLETGTTDGWSTLHAELLAKVLEALEVDGGSKPGCSTRRGALAQANLTGYDYDYDEDADEEESNPDSDWAGDT
jgi:hypothetical protein